MKKRYTKRQIAEAISYWEKTLSESGQSQSRIDDIMLDEAIADSAGFDFACECSGLLENGALASENCVLEPESLATLKKLLSSVQRWKKTYLCGNVKASAYSADTAASSYGYEELDAGAQPQDGDEEAYLADRQKWYEDYVDDALYDGMPSKVFGAELHAEPFLLRARRQNGEGIGLACRLVSFW